jgi:prepilin-type N-terminal cleavage/methylation domain-containing protein
MIFERGLPVNRYQGYSSLNMPDLATVKTEKANQGFSLIEMMIVVAVMMILGAITGPSLFNSISDIRLRYSASNFAGILQSARIQSVRKNTFYSVDQVTLASGDQGYYVDIPKSGTFAAGDPIMPLGRELNVHPGIGSGAPNEAAFITSLNFAVNPGASAPNFNARGLPCVAAVNACPQTPGQGFVVFLSRASLTGNVRWAAIVVNPSGRVQVWTDDSTGNWIQRD